MAARPRGTRRTRRTPATRSKTLEPTTDAAAISDGSTADRAGTPTAPDAPPSAAEPGP
jgi:hypothetical protein